jgi:predicted transcriptional regulator
MNISRETKYQRQIDWRREKVLELASDGYGVREIARLLEISHPTVSRDMQWLRYQAKEQIRKYIDEQVPLEYHKTLTGLQNIIKSMSDIISKSSDNREIMQASGIKIQALNMKMELVSNANLVHEAIDLVERYRSYTGQKVKVVIAEEDGNKQPSQNC